MPKKRRFDFTKKNKRSGKVENVGYLDLEQDEEQNRCSLYFYGDIVSATWESMWYEEDRCPQDIADFLNQLDGYEDIDIYFNSGGGDVFAGLAIYNQLKRYDGHKVGYVDGMAASIASVIMFACDELHFATGAQAMIHKPLCMAYGNADDFKAVIKQLNLCEDSILDVYMEHVQEGVTRDKIQSLMSNETWFDSKKMQQYFNVEIEEKAAVAACASDFFEKYNNIPEALKGIDTKDIVDAVIAELENRNNVAAEAEKQRIEAEKQQILDDLYLYSDDGTEEVINSYEGTEIELEVNALAPQDRQILFGQLYENGFLVKTADDKAPEVAVGWRERKLNGKYDFKWLYAGKFAEGISEEASTKEGKLSPTTKSVKGSFYERSLDNAYEISVDESNLVTEDTKAAEAIKNWFSKVQEKNGGLG